MDRGSPSLRMVQVFKDENAGPFTEDEPLSSPVKGFAVLRIDKLQAAESAIGNLAEGITSAGDHQVGQTHLNHFIGDAN